MVNYEVVYKDLNQFSKSVFEKIKSKYPYRISSKSQKKIDQLLHGEGLNIFFQKDFFQLSICKEEVVKKRILQIKYHIIEQLVSLFVDLHGLGNLTVLEQDCANCLRNEFVLELTRELARDWHLEVEMEEDSFPFIRYLQTQYDSCFDNLKDLVFSNDYMQFSEEFYGQTGEDLLDVYMDYLGHKEEDLEYNR